MHQGQAGTIRAGRREGTVGGVAGQVNSSAPGESGDIIEHQGEAKHRQTDIKGNNKQTKT